MSNFNVITLFLQTSLAVQIVVGFLVVLAIVSWFLIFRVGGRISGIQKFDDDFEAWLWSGENLQTRYDMVSNDFERVGLEQIFYIGYDQFSTIQKITNNHAYVLQVTERKFNIILTKQKLILKDGLSTLANISTIAPYLGLLGAIWGMVGAFSLSDTITLSTITPDIVEALLIVALGLFTAISTKWAVNYFEAKIEDVHENRVLFCEELLSVFAHQHMIAQKALQAQLPPPVVVAPAPNESEPATLIAPKVEPESSPKAEPPPTTKTEVTEEYDLFTLELDTIVMPQAQAPNSHNLIK